MSHVYYKCWYHIIWTTHKREPLLTKKARKKLFGHIRRKAAERGYHLDTINGVEDHVHCLFSLHPKFAISKVVKDIKGESSHWMNEEENISDYFKWQDGYSVFSISEREVEKVRAYIFNQEVHHQSESIIADWEI
jgi:putative transposase